MIDLIQRMKVNTVANGCTPGEAAKFAAKVAELIEKFLPVEIHRSEADAVEIEGADERSVPGSSQPAKATPPSGWLVEIRA